MVIGSRRIIRSCSDGRVGTGEKFVHNFVRRNLGRRALGRPKRKGRRKGKGKVHPRTGHEGPKGK